jgi:hypothetical protein
MSSPPPTWDPDHDAVSSPVGVFNIMRAFAPVVSDITCFHAGEPGPWGRTKMEVRKAKAISPADIDAPLVNGGSSPPKVRRFKL